MNDVNPADAGNKPPAVETPEAAPANPVETPAAPEPGAPATPTPAEPPKPEHDWKDRYDKASQASKQQSEEAQAVIDSNVKLVEKNPELLDDLAESNPKLADQISKKLHDKDYDTYRKDKELEGLKETDPDKYAHEKRMQKIEGNDAKRTESERKSFLESKGIKDNQFDPSYKKVEAELKMLNPQYVEDNPTEAWAKAYQLAFPSGINPQKTKEDADLAANTNKKNGGLSSILSHKTSEKTPEAKAFGDQMSKLTG